MTKKPPLQESPNSLSESVQPVAQVQTEIAAPVPVAAQSPTVDEQLAKLPRWEAAALQAQHRWPQGLRLSVTEFEWARESLKGSVIR